MAGRKKRTRREPLTDPVTLIGAAPSKRAQKGARQDASPITADRREAVSEQSADRGQLGRVIPIRPVQVEGAEYELPEELVQRLANPGLTPRKTPKRKLRGRKERHKESVLRISRYLRETYGLSPDIATEAADVWVSEREHLPGYEELWEEWAPSSTSPNRLNIREECEYAAVYRQPVVRWLREWMCTRNEGRPAQRGQVVDALMHQAWGMGRPSLKASRDAFSAGHTLLSWAFDTPQVTLTANAYYESQASIINEKPAVACLAVAVDLFRQITELRDEKGKLRFPKAGRVLVVDGTKAEADVKQFLPTDDELRALLRGKGREMVEMCVYGDGDGRPKEKWAGYKLVILSCIDTGLPVVWKLVPANATERDVALDLIRRLFDLWLEAPVEALVGDSHYDQSEEFARELVFNYGISPIFDQHGTFSEGWDHSATLGVPTCPHGHMTPAWIVGPLTRQQRDKKGLAPGESGNPNTRIRWRCPKEKEHPECKMLDTYPKVNPRLYTMHPRDGESTARVQREVWLARRNTVESLNSLVKHRGLAGRQQERAAKATDKRMDWLLSLGLLYIVGRRLIHEGGDYERCRAESEELGLMANPSPEQLAPGREDPEIYKAMLAKRDEEWGPMRAPCSLAVNLTGYYSVGEKLISWAAEEAA